MSAYFRKARGMGEVRESMETDRSLVRGKRLRLIKRVADNWAAETPVDRNDRSWKRFRKDQYRLVDLEDPDQGTHSTPEDPKRDDHEAR